MGLTSSGEPMGRIGLFLKLDTKCEVQSSAGPDRANAVVWRASRRGSVGGLWELRTAPGEVLNVIWPLGGHR